MEHILDLEAKGMIGDDSSTANLGVRDNAPIWNKNIPQAKPGTTILLPAGYCSFKTPILSLPDGCKLVGQGSGSHMVRNFSQNDNSFFLTTGITDSWTEAVRLWAADGTSGGRAIGREATSPADAPFHTVIKNVEVTRFNTGRFTEGVHVDGVKGQPMYGARRFQGEDIIISGCDYIGMWLGGMNSAGVVNLAAGAGGPTWAVWLYGVPGVNPCNQIKLDGPIDGSLIMYAALVTKIESSSFSLIIIDNNCSGVEVEAAYLAKEPPLLYGTNNTVEANGKRWVSSPNGAVLA